MTLGALDFRVLGPLELVRSGQLPVTRGKELSLLALLLLCRNEVVSTERLVDELWAGKPPRPAQTALHGYAGKLRSGAKGDTSATGTQGPQGRPNRRAARRAANGRRAGLRRAGWCRQWHAWVDVSGAPGILAACTAVLSNSSSELGASQASITLP